MEQWTDAFKKSFSAENEEEREESQKNILEHIQHLSPTFFENSFLILQDSSIDYNIRHASAIYLSKFLFATQKIRMNSIENFLHDSSKQEMIFNLQEVILSLIFEDDGLLQRECIHILALLFYFNTEQLFDAINNIFDIFDDKTKANIPLHLFYDILNHPFIESFSKNENIQQILFKAFQSCVGIIQIPYTDQSDIELRKIASEDITLVLSSLPKFINELEHIQIIFAALPSSFLIPDTSLFSSLHQIMYLLIINNYQYKNELFDTILQYITNDLSVNNDNYMEIVLQFIDYLSENELKLVNKNNNLIAKDNNQEAMQQEEDHYISTKLLHSLFNNLAYLFLNFLKDEKDNTLYNFIISIFTNIINIEPLFITKLLMQNIDDHIESSEMEDHCIILNLIAIFGQLNQIDDDLEISLYEYFQPKLTYLKDMISRSIETPQMLYLSLFATTKIVSRFPSLIESSVNPSQIIHEFLESVEIDTITDSSIIVSYISMLSSFCKAFDAKRPSNPFTDDDLFPNIVELFILLFQYPYFADHPEIITTLTKAIKIFVQCSSVTTNKIPLFQLLLTNLEESFSENNYIYQSLICSMLYQVINFTKSLAHEYFPTLHELLIHILDYHDSPSFTYALPTFAISICYMSFDPIIMETFIKYVQEGISSDDPSVILYTNISLLKVLQKHEKYIFPWIQQLFEILYESLKAPDQNCRETAIPYLIRTLTKNIEIADKTNNDEYQEQAHCFIAQQEEWMTLMLTHFISEISYSFNYDDEIDFADKMFGSISYSIGVYSQVYRSEGNRDKELAFFRTIFRPFTNVFSPLLEIKNDTCIDFFFMLKNLSMFISRNNHGRICAKPIQRKLKIIEEKHIYPEEIKQIKICLFGSDSYEFLK